MSAVKACGYECAVAVGERTKLTADSTYVLPRIIMSRDMDVNRFKSLLSRTRLEMELRRRYRLLREKGFVIRRKDLPNHKMEQG